MTRWIRVACATIVIAAVCAMTFSTTLAASSSDTVPAHVTPDIGIAHQVFYRGNQVAVWTTQETDDKNTYIWSTSDLSGHVLSSGTMKVSTITVGDPVNGIFAIEFYAATITQTVPYPGTAKLHLTFVSSPIIGASGSGTGYMSCHAQSPDSNRCGTFSVRWDFREITVGRSVPVMFNFAS